MYRVITIITPLNYAATLNKAIEAINLPSLIRLTELDACLLNSLQIADKGLRCRTLMMHAKKRMNIDSFHTALLRLESRKYIVRTEYNRAVYYSITLQGIDAVHQINQEMTKIIELTHGPQPATIKQPRRKPKQKASV